MASSSSQEGEKPVMYEELAELEKDFEDAEVEILRQSNKLNDPLYAKRTALVSRIPNFWPLVFEQSPPDIDQYINPSDSAVLSALTSFEVFRFEIASSTTSSHTARGDPRSVSFRFRFQENEYFDDEVLEKKFWYRRARNGWTGLVSHPVKIMWKEGKDLTSGALELAAQVWERETAEREAKASRKGTNGSANGKSKSKAKHVPGYDALVRKVEKTTQGSISFFAWFGYRGRDVSAEESTESEEKEAARREKFRKGIPEIDGPETVDLEDEDGKDDAAETEREIFPGGEDLAVSLSEDLYPGALKYFAQAQELDMQPEFSDEEDLEEDSDGADGGDGNFAAIVISDDERPPKRRRE